MFHTCTSSGFGNSSKLHCLAMDETQILQRFEGKTILITGATGFLAKIFVEKILRLQPNVKKIFLLIRDSGKGSGEQRLQEEVVGKEVFAVLREMRGESFTTFISSKLIPISGNTACENLGIMDAQLRQDMCRQIHIIVNSAATTKFYDRYDVSFGTNTIGAMHVQQFGAKCSNLQMLLHVSTAYVNGTGVGVFMEKAFGMGETLSGAKIPILDINLEKTIIDQKLQYLQNQNLNHKEITKAMQELGSERAMLHGWPNTYVFTKAMGEMVVETLKQNCNVVIIRPTVITSTFKDPFPGWVEGIRTVDGIFVGLGKGNLKFLLGDPESVIDLIPGDMVVNCMIGAIATHLSEKPNLMIYQIGSSRRNPVKYEEILLSMVGYLGEHPLLDANAKPITVARPTLFNSMPSFYNHVKLRYFPLLKTLRLINLVFCNVCKSSYTNAERRISYAVRVAELYKPYYFSKEIYDDGHTQNLRMRMRGSSVLDFDPKCIAWEEYLYNTHFPGVLKYALN